MSAGRGGIRGYGNHVAFSVLALLYLILFSGHVQETEGYSSGAPSARCGDMQPSTDATLGHGATAQTGASPFRVTSNVPQTGYTLGDPYIVTVARTSMSGSETFKGLFCQARSATSDGSFAAASASPAGMFAASSTNEVQQVTCNSVTGGGITHSGKLGTGDAGVPSITLQWTAPSAAPSAEGGRLIFVCTIVQDKATYWVQVPSASTITPAAAAATTAAPAAVTTAAPAAVTTAAPTAATTADPTAVTTPASTGTTCTGSAGGVAADYCFRFPPNCTTQASCQYIYSERKQNGRLTVELVGETTQGQGYVAVGYSNDTTMGSDDILACEVDSTGMVNAKNLHSVGRTVVLDSKGAANEITLSTSSQTGGKIYCRFSRPLAINSPADDDFNLATATGVTMLFARRTTGTAAATATLSGQHDVTPMTAVRTFPQSGSGQLQYSVTALLMVIVWPVYFLI